MIQGNPNPLNSDYKVKLGILAHEYKFIAFTCQLHKKTLQQLKIHPKMKEGLIRDIDIITSILGKSEIKEAEKEVTKYGI
jgi:hypothetical protein